MTREDKTHMQEFLENVKSWPRAQREYYTARTEEFMREDERLRRDGQKVKDVREELHRDYFGMIGGIDTPDMEEGQEEE